MRRSRSEHVRQADEAAAPVATPDSSANGAHTRANSQRATMAHASKQLCKRPHTSSESDDDARASEPTSNNNRATHTWTAKPIIWREASSTSSR